MMTSVNDPELTVVILANRQSRFPLSGQESEPAALLAVQRVCGVPLVRRHLQVVRAYEWRNVIVVVPPAGKQAVEEAIGDAAALGMQVSYVQADEGALPVHALLERDMELCLVLEGHYVIEGALLAVLRAAGAEAVLCDSQPGEGRHLALQVQDGQVIAYGQQATQPTHAYAGAVLLSRTALQQLAAVRGDRSWPMPLSHLPALKAVDTRRSDLYVAEVRRRVEPFWQAVETPADAERCKRALVTGAQKHTLDMVAWYVNRPLESALTLRIADWPITPNQVTIFTSLLAYVVAALFLMGYLVPASLLTFVINVLDGVDGKLARVKALSSRLGQLEHSLDLLYEQSWYLAFTWASYAQHRQLWVLAVGFLMLLWDSFARHVSMQFRQVMGVSLADYAPFDRAFRRFDGRRNIYTLYMFAGVITQRPYYALCLMALHAAVTGLVYALRAARHLRNADRGWRAMPG